MIVAYRLSRKIIGAIEYHVVKWQHYSDSQLTLIIALISSYALFSYRLDNDDKAPADPFQILSRDEDVKKSNNL